MNKTILSGRLVADPNLMYTAEKGTAITRFTLAVSRPFKKEETDFINCKAFGKAAETIAQYLTKGRQALVVGSIQTGSYEKDGIKRYTTEVIVENFEFLGSSNKDNNSNSDSTEDYKLEEMMPEGEEDMPW